LFVDEDQLPSPAPDSGEYSSKVQQRGSSRHGRRRRPRPRLPGRSAARRVRR
jgi:hypothetical protein